MIQLPEDVSEYLCDSTHPWVDISPKLKGVELLKLSQQAAKENLFLCSLANQVKHLVNQQGYAQIQGAPFDIYPALYIGFISLIGNIYTDHLMEQSGDIIIGSHCVPNGRLMGDYMKSLPLHTDYSMLLMPTRYTCSVCIQPSPVANTGSLEIVDVESCLYGLGKKGHMKNFFDVLLPFASLIEQDKTALIHRPILEYIIGEPNRLLVRYHRSRIAQGFAYQNIEPNKIQQETILSFENYVRAHRQPISINEKGTLTIVDNHRCLHARTACSVSLSLQGELDGRKMAFIFTQD